MLQVVRKTFQRAPRNIYTSRGIISSWNSIDSFNATTINSKWLSTLKDNSKVHSFMSFYPKIVQDVAEEAGRFDQRYMPDWVRQILDYNLKLGKHDRGVATVLAYKTLFSPEEIIANRHDLELANYLGWCVDMLHTMLLITDDIMDKCEFRRGQLCWHKVDGVHMTAVNDAILIENAVYFILSKYFREKSCYVDLLELFQENSLMTTFGQTLDMQMTQKPISEFTSDIYISLTKLKTSYYSLYLPVALAMQLAGITDLESYEQVKEVLMKCGTFFQIHNDFKEYKAGAHGTDIQNNKCTWLAVTCMERATKEQRELIVQNYGQEDLAKVDTIRKIYDEMCITDIYKEHQNELYQNILIGTEQISRPNVRKIIYNMMDEFVPIDSKDLVSC